MTWDEGAGSVVTGAIGLGVGVVVAGKLIKDISSIKKKDDGELEMTKGWRL